MITLQEISENLQKGRAKLVKEQVATAIEEGLSPEAILTEGLLDGMDKIGERFKNGEVYVPEVLIAARAMSTASRTAATSFARPTASSRASRRNATR